MSKSRLFNTNERVTSTALNDAQAISAGSHATDASRLPPTGAVLLGLHPQWTTAGTSMVISKGKAVISGTDAMEYGWNASDTTVSLTGITAPGSGKVRIDTVYAEIGTPTDSTSESVYVRDPITGVVSSSALMTRRLNTLAYAIQAGSTVTAASFSPATSGSSALVARASSFGVGKLPIAYLFLVGTSAVPVAVVDARTLAGVGGGMRLLHPGADGSKGGADDYLPAFGNVAHLTDWGKYSFIGTDAGTGTTNTLRFGSLETTGIPTRVARFVDQYGCSRVLPYGYQVSGSPASDPAEIHLLAYASSQVWDLAMTVSGASPGEFAIKIVEFDLNGSGGMNYRNIWDGWSYGKQGVAPANEDVVRVYPKIMPQNNAAGIIQIRIAAVLADGSDVPVGIRTKGITWKVEIFTNTMAQKTTGITINTATGTVHNCEPLTSSTTADSTTGRLFFVQGTGDDLSNYCEIALVNTSGFSGDFYVQVTPVMPTQTSYLHPDYNHNTDPITSGLFYYVPGGPGLAFIQVT